LHDSRSYKGRALSERVFARRVAGTGLAKTARSRGDA
jgi:hypothetical protein